MIILVLPFLIVNLICHRVNSVNRDSQETSVVRIALHPPHPVGGLPKFGMYARNRTASFPFLV